MDNINTSLHKSTQNGSTNVLHWSVMLHCNNCNTSKCNKSEHSVQPPPHSSACCRPSHPLWPKPGTPEQCMLYTAWCCIAQCIFHSTECKLHGAYFTFFIQQTTHSAYYTVPNNRSQVPVELASAQIFLSLQLWATDAFHTLVQRSNAVQICVQCVLAACKCIVHSSVARWGAVCD